MKHLTFIPVFIILILYNINLYCQNDTVKIYCQNDTVKNINFIIFVNAKIPSDFMDGNLEFLDSLNNSKIINFKYWAGNLQISLKEWKLLNENNKDMCSDVIMKLNYRSVKPIDNRIRSYKISLTKFDFYTLTTIIMIADINIKKRIYCYDIYADHIDAIGSCDNKIMRKSRELIEEDEY